MVLASLIGGAGATNKQDGWNAVGLECCFGAPASGDIEIPDPATHRIHRYGLVKDSGGAGATPGWLRHAVGGGAA